MANPTLNVNGTGAKAIYSGAAAIPAAAIQPGYTYSFRYNGSQWELVGSTIALRLGTSSVGSNTRPIYLNGGTPTALSYTAHRLYYSASTSSFEATGHYASASKIAINSTGEPT